MNRLRFFYDIIIDLVYPNVCIFCNELKTGGKDSICDACWNALPAFPVEQNILREIKEKLATLVYLSNLRSMWEFEDNVQIIIHRLKYKHKTSVAAKISQYMSNLIEFDKDIDLLIPVPLHKKRRRERGYNQSTLICKAISKIKGIPTNEISLQRIKNTKSQTKLNINERKKNVADAFRVVNRSEIENKTILLVDDVITTGSTINACAQQLKNNGAKEIYAISAAKA